MRLARAVRRKYGIPDSSKEPFNVAYAKAEKRKKEERLRQSQTQTTSRIFDRQEMVPQLSAHQRAPKLSTPQQRATPASCMSLVYVYIFLANDALQRFMVDDRLKEAPSRALGMLRYTCQLLKPPLAHLVCCVILVNYSHLMHC